MNYIFLKSITPIRSLYGISTLLLILFLLLPDHTIFAQKSPSKAQEVSITLRGGTFHVGNGKVIQNGHLLFESGKISYVGSQAQSADRIIDVSGHHVYPGLIAPNTNIGLTEVGAVRATRDYLEVGEYNPHVRALIAYNTDSRIIPTIRSNGILLAEIAPQGGILSGQSTVVQFDAWNWEDAAVKDTAALHLNWPDLYSYDREAQRTSINKEYTKQVRNLKNYFREAIAYGQREEQGPVNLRFKALSTILARDIPIFVHVNDEKAMLDVIRFSNDMALSVVLVGATDSWKIADQLAQTKTPVILTSTQRLPRRADTDIDQPFKTPKILQDAGVLWCFSHEGFWDQRNLPFQGGQAVGFGLDPEMALQGMTLNTAKILNLDDRYGTLEEGKSATVVISDGNILDPQTSIILQAFIDGREVDLDNKQKKLYRKFGEKHGVLK